MPFTIYYYFMTHISCMAYSLLPPSKVSHSQEVYCFSFFNKLVWLESSVNEIWESLCLEVSFKHTCGKLGCNAILKIRNTNIILKFARDCKENDHRSLQNLWSSQRTFASGQACTRTDKRSGSCLTAILIYSLNSRELEMCSKGSFRPIISVHFY